MGKDTDNLVNNLFDGVNDKFNQDHLSSFIKHIDANLRSVDFGKWLYQYKGLGLQKVIEGKLQQSENHRSVGDQEVLKNTFEGIELLYNNNHERTKQYIRKEGEDTYYLKNRWGGEKYFIKDNGDGTYSTNFEFYHGEDGKWHQVNKLNTNYSDLNRLVKEIVSRYYNEMVFFTIKNEQDLKKFLTQNSEILKDKILSLPEEEIISFVEHSTKMSEIGENTEKDIVVKIRKKWGDEAIIWSGGNGDIIDMLLGIDIILLRDGKANTLQAKTRLPNDLSNEMERYPYIDFFAGNRGGELVVVRAKEQQQLKKDKQDNKTKIVELVKQYEGDNSFMLNLRDFAKEKGYLSDKQLNIAKRILNLRENITEYVDKLLDL